MREACTQLAQIALHDVNKYLLLPAWATVKWTVARASNSELATLKSLNNVHFNAFCLTFFVLALICNKTNSDWHHRSSLKFFGPWFVKWCSRSSTLRQYFTNLWQKISMMTLTSHYLYNEGGPISCTAPSADPCPMRGDTLPISFPTRRLSPLDNNNNDSSVIITTPKRRKRW